MDVIKIWCENFELRSYMHFAPICKFRCLFWPKINSFFDSLVDNDGHKNLYDVALPLVKTRLWRTPSHVDVCYEDKTWATWELGCIVLIDSIQYKLVDVISDRNDVITGDFKSVVSSVPSIKRELRKLSKAPAALNTPVYNVYIIIGHDDLLGEL